MSTYTPQSNPAPPRSKNRIVRRMGRRALWHTSKYALFASLFLGAATAAFMKLSLFIAIGGWLLVACGLIAVAFLLQSVVLGRIEEELGANRDAAADSVGNPHINISSVLYDAELQAQCYSPTFRILPFVHLVISPIGIILAALFNMFGIFVFFIYIFSTAWFLTRVVNNKPKLEKLDHEDIKRSNRAWRNAHRYLYDDDDDDDPDRGDTTIG